MFIYSVFLVSSLLYISCSKNLVLIIIILFIVFKSLEYNLLEITIYYVYIINYIVIGLPKKGITLIKYIVIL